MAKAPNEEARVCAGNPCELRLQADRDSVTHFHTLLALYVVTESRFLSVGTEAPPACSCSNRLFHEGQPEERWLQVRVAFKGEDRKRLVSDRS